MDLFLRQAIDGSRHLGLWNGTGIKLYPLPSLQLDRRWTGLHPHAERRKFARTDTILRPHRAR